MCQLSGEQSEGLRIGLQRAFPERTDLQIFLKEKLERELAYYVGPSAPLPHVIFNLLEAAQAEGWLKTLVAKANRTRPHIGAIAKIAQELGLALPAGAQPVEADDELASSPPLWRSLNPYRGLLALREEDANFLFGRDDDIVRFIDAIANQPDKLLLALGASGVGKSSLIYAGVFAALNRQVLPGRKDWPSSLTDSARWPRLSLRPGIEPVRSIAGAFVGQWVDSTTPAYREVTNDWRRLLVNGDNLNGLIDAADEGHRRNGDDPPPRYLIYVDQGEELYTRGGRDPGRDSSAKETLQQKEARCFSELLAEAALNERLVVLMSARSDFLGQLQDDKRTSDAHPAKIFDAHERLEILKLSDIGLQQVITRPAELLGVRFENGLDNALATATREEIGGLPLLSYTLETLWQEMQAREDDTPVLRWSPPGKPVDVANKLAERADAFVKRHKAQEPALQRLFCVRLAHVPAQGDPTRQRAFLDELSPEERTLARALAGGEQRIVVTSESEGRAIAEVAHEKLFSAWETLQTWLASRRGFYAWVTQIEAWQKDWERDGRQQKDLLSGRPLELARGYLASDEADIPARARAFTRESIEAEHRRIAMAAENERQRREAELKAEHLAREHAQRMAEAAHRTVLGQSKYLSELSHQATDRGNAGLGVLLALEALPDLNSPDPTARERPYWGPAEVALESARRALREQQILAGHAGAITSVAVTPDGSRIVTGSNDNTARIWEAASGRELAQLTGHANTVGAWR